MGLFGDDEENETEEVDPPELDETDTGADEAADVGDEPTDQGGADPEEIPSEEKGDSGDGPESDIDVEEALKDLSARMSMLSSNLEGVQDSRGELEDKIVSVEERMSRLGSLAEAVSSEYNPFVSENAPAEPSWTPDGDGDTPEPSPTGAPGPAAGIDEEENGRAPEAAEAVAGETVPETEDTGASLDPTPAGDPDDDGIGSAGPADDAQAVHKDPPTEASIPRTDREELEPAPTEEVDREPPRSPLDGRGSRDNGHHEEPGELEENLLLLEWVGMMLDRVGRAGLMDLLDYYQNLGWLDRGTKDQATRVAVGVDAPDSVDEGHWRGDVDLHRRSLVAIQRLQGSEIPAARLDELELDLRRLFRE